MPALRRSTLSRTCSGLAVLLLAGVAMARAQDPHLPMDLDAHTTTCTIRGLDFPVVDVGEGPAVLLLHGFPDSRHLWRHQVPALAEAGYRVLAPDLRGFGDAPKPEAVEDYALAEVMHDLLGLLDALGVDEAHVVGHDWGGTAAWVFAALHPDRTRSVTGLTVGAPGAPGRRSLDQLEKLWYVFFFQNEGVAEEWLRRDDWQGLRAWLRGAGDVERIIAQLEKPGALTSGLNWYRANFPPSSLNRTSSSVPRIQVPALGLAAEHDAYLLEGHVKNSASVIDAPWRYHLVEGASHWLMLDRPDEVNRLLLAFLGDVERGTLDE